MGQDQYQHWGYLSTDPPTGFSASNIIAVYQFSDPTNGLTDRTGNGHTLTVASGHGYSWCPMYEAYGCVGLATGIHAGNDWAETARGNNGLDTVGNATAELVLLRYRMSQTDDTYNAFFTVGGIATSENENIIFQIYGSDNWNRLGICVQYNTKVRSPTVNTEQRTVCMTGVMVYLAVVRISGTVYEYYFDGEKKGTITLGNAPTMGVTPNVHLAIGGHSNNNQSTSAIFQSVRWSHAAMTADQIAETYTLLRIPGA